MYFIIVAWLLITDVISSSLLTVGLVYVDNRQPKVSTRLECSVWDLREERISVLEHSRILSERYHATNYKRLLLNVVANLPTDRRLAWSRPGDQFDFNEINNDSSLHFSPSPLSPRVDYTYDPRQANGTLMRCASLYDINSAYVLLNKCK